MLIGQTNVSYGATEENVLSTAFFTRNLFVTIVFGIIMHSIIQTAQGQSIKLGSWFLPTIVAFSLIIPIIIFIYQRKYLSK